MPYRVLNSLLFTTTTSLYLGHVDNFPYSQYHNHYIMTLENEWHNPHCDRSWFEIKEENFYYVVIVEYCIAQYQLYSSQYQLLHWHAHNTPKSLFLQSMNTNASSRLADGDYITCGLK